MAEYREAAVRIPELLGPSNLEAWKRTVKVHLTASRNIAFIGPNTPLKPQGAEDSDDVGKWLSRRTMTWYSMRSTIDKVVVELEKNNWDRRKDDEDQNPKALWDKVLETIGKTADSRVDDLIDEHYSLTVEKFRGDVKKYTDRWLEVKQALDQAEVVIPQRALMRSLVNGLSSSYPSAVAIALGSCEGDKRTPANFISRVLENTSIMKASATTVLANARSKAPDEAGKAAPEKTKCNKCEFVSAHPHHDACGRHHRDGDKGCWALHPELKAEFLKNKKEKSEKKTESNARASDVAPNLPAQRGSAHQYEMGNISMANVAASDMVIGDTGSSEHHFNDLKWFVSLEKSPEPYEATTATSESNKSYYQGKVVVPWRSSEGISEVTTTAYYSPKMPYNLLSLGKMRAKGMRDDQVNNEFYHEESGRRIGTYTFRNNVVVADTVAPEAQQTTLKRLQAVLAMPNAAGPADEKVTAKATVPAPTGRPVPYVVMHRRLMHANKDAVLKACREAGIRVSAAEADKHVCEDCVQGKATQVIGTRQFDKSQRPLARIHMDTIGITPTTGNGFNHVVHLQDEATSFGWVLFSKRKDTTEVAHEVIDWIQRTELQTGIKIQALHTDGGTEFAPAMLRRWCKKHGKALEESAARCPEMNGIVERANRTLVNAARTALNANNFEKKHWDYAIAAARKIINYTPSSANDDRKSPYKAWMTAIGRPESQQKPPLKTINTWGSVVQVLIKDPKQLPRADKMAKRTAPGRLFGWEGTQNEILLVKMDADGRVLRVRDAHVIEGTGRNKKVRFDSIKEGTEAHDTANEGVVEDVYISAGDWVYTDPGAPGSEADATDGGAADDEADGGAADGEADSGTDVEDSAGAGNILTPEETPDRSLADDSGGVIAEGLAEGPAEDSEGPDEGPAVGNEATPGAKRAYKKRPPPPPSDRTFRPRAPRVPVYASIIPKTRRKRTTAKSAPEEAVVEDSEGASAEKNNADGASDAGSEEYRSCDSGDEAEIDAFAEGTAMLSFKVTYVDDDVLVDAVPGGFEIPDLQLVNVLPDARTPYIPNSYRDALKHPDEYNKHYLPAMQKQVTTLQEKGTWVMVMPPAGAKVLPGKWVYVPKNTPEGKFKEIKARWVVCGNFEDTTGENKAATYAAVAHATSTRVFFAVVAVRDMACKQYDFVGAYLGATVPGDTDVYVQQPQGIAVGEKGQVCELRKALYGLRKAPLWWYNTVTPFLKALGFVPVHQDVCLYVRRATGGMLLLYVDDMQIAATTDSEIEAIASEISKRFEITALGDSQTFLGMQVVRDKANKTICLYQRDYITKIITKYGREDLHPVKTPWPSGFVIPATWDPLPASEVAVYQSEVASLGYLSGITRPDMTFTVRRLQEAQSGPGKEHLQLMKHLWRYLTGTRQYALRLGSKDYTHHDMGLKAYGDASFANCLRTRASTGGVVIMLAGGPVHWQSKRQSFVTASTTEAEFVNLLPTGRCGLWINGILDQLGCPQDELLVVHTDSANAQATVLNPLQSARTRMIDLRYKWVIDAVQRGCFTLKLIGTANMKADGFTKGLTADGQAKFVAQMGMVLIA
ncbi:hypothetical protein RB600_006432 [Gaeumannomyces tritici]